MIKKISVLLIFVLQHFMVFSQASGTSSALDFLNNLPTNTQGMFLGEQSGSTGPEQANSLIQKENPDKDIFVNPEDEKFGFDFYDNILYSTNAPLMDIPLMADYTISFGDKISLVMYGNRSRSITLQVSLNGSINIPEVGDVNINGLSIMEAQSKIEEIVARALTGTSVDVNVKQAGFRKISILGSVKSPGIYIINPYLSVIEALRYADGLSENSSLRTITVRKNDNRTVIFDAYEYLVYGDTGSNVSLENGDVILMSETDNFVKIKGAVMRPKIYEYNKDETIGDLIKFAQGFESSANKDSITATFQENGVVRSSRVVLEDKVPLNLRELNISSNVEIDERDIEVYGSSVSNGSFSKESYSTLTELVDALSFSPNVFPYFSMLEQNDNESFGKEIISFSLADRSSLENIDLKNNVKITFLSRQDVEDLQFLAKFNDIEFESLQRINDLENQKTEILDAYFESAPDSFISDIDLQLAENQKERYDENPFEPPSTEYDQELERKELLLQELKNKVDTQTEFTTFFQKRLSEIEYELNVAKNGFKELRKRKISDFNWTTEIIEYLERNSLIVNLGKDKFLFPLTGNFLPNRIIDYIGRDVSNYDYQNAKILMKSFDSPISELSESILFQSGGVFSIPLVLEQNIQVKILGNVKSPGEFTVPINSTLQDLYVLAGGLEPSADDKSIIFARESLKEKEKTALESAKRILIDSVISRSSSAAGAGNIGSLLPLIELSDKTKPVGRISGDLSFNSNTSKDLLLENGDTIVVPSKSNVVNILGQVLSPTTVVYDPKLSYKKYVGLAGGYNYYADKKNIYVIRSNGLSQPLSNSAFRNGYYDILPGDTIVVPRNFSRAELLGNLSIATRVISDISIAAASLNVIAD